MEIRFQYERDRASQTVLWLLHRHGGSLDKLKLVKLIFFADRGHLAKYGRPIVGGSYVAMRHGPVCSELLDDINRSAKAGLPYRLGGDQVRAQDSTTEEMLSESDIEVLHDVDQQLGQMDTFHLRDHTHSLQAWKNNYRQDTSTPIPYEDFFLDLGTSDCEMLEIIREDQEAHRVLSE